MISIAGSCFQPRKWLRIAWYGYLLHLHVRVWTWVIKIQCRIFLDTLLTESLDVTRMSADFLSSRRSIILSKSCELQLAPCAPPVKQSPAQETVSILNYRVDRRIMQSAPETDLSETSTATRLTSSRIDMFQRARTIRRRSLVLKYGLFTRCATLLRCPRTVIRYIRVGLF